ncbi:MAG TPA: GNAT family N-acetyltransferase [Rhizomicrobium sp.]|jgi:GNAT superfamily N-acetyltransferase|nr:GNAT family N-acetyltransferase [Rhizomicrobium sp.]
MPAFSVRPVVPSDYAQWLPLWDGYNAFYGRSGATALPKAMTELTWARFLDEQEPMHALVAEADGQLVGLAHYLFHRNTITAGLSCYMQDLFTAAATRKSGVGRALIEAVYERARAAGSPRVYWHTQNENATARRLYDQVAAATGFIVYAKSL